LRAVWDSGVEPCSWAEKDKFKRNPPGGTLNAQLGHWVRGTGEGS